MRVRITDTGIYFSPCATRTPFKFGAVTLTRGFQGLARVRVEDERGRVGVGHAADLLVPKWFEKDPAKTPHQDATALIESAAAAAQAFERAVGAGGRTVFDAWWDVYRERVHTRAADAPDRLVRGFGVALVERALMDAACRVAGLGFLDALRRDLFGFQPGTVLPQLAEWNPASLVPGDDPSVLRVRHTVGMSDPLRPGEITGPRIGDGLPECLEEDIAEYGLSCFKIKIGAGHACDRERLLDVGGLLADLGTPETLVTLDGNEQFESMRAVAELLDDVSGDPAGRFLLDRLELIEQPLDRRRTFDPAANEGIGHVSAVAPVIIDEADHGLEAFPDALSLGYAGVSVKNCKGVFRALMNAGLCRLHEGAFQSAEDLTNLGGLALQQNLATLAAIGFSHVEMNGHHYFRGLGHLPAEEAEAAARSHPDLYDVRDGQARVRIEDGRVRFASIHGPGYGYAFPVSHGSRSGVAAWPAE